MNKNKIIIYQIFTRLFGNKKTKCKIFGSRKENGVGKFSDINDLALSEIKKLGITHIWYTGIIEHACAEGYPEFGIENDNPLIIKGKAGSPYAIKDYYDVSPDLADNVNNRMQEFEDLVKRTHNNDLKIIIDFVPNHLAREYKSDMKPKSIKDFGEDDDISKSFNKDNNFYYIVGEEFVVPKDIAGNYKKLISYNTDKNYYEYPAKVTGNDKFTSKPCINDWYETIKLNYGVDYKNNGKKHFNPIPDTWLKMKNILIFWAKKGIDGFRCDMAEMVPVEFWNWLIPEVRKQNPEILFIAEIYKPSLYSDYINFGHFDYLYDKVGLYDTLAAIITGKKPASEITLCWQNLNGLDTCMLRFLENHDEKRIASKYFAGNAQKAIPAMVLAATLNKGPVMIYSGQEIGEHAEGISGFSGDDGRTTIFDYWNVPEHQKWMNNGKFDGKLLNNKQIQLRDFYKKLLNLCQTNEAIYNGEFYDLLWYNKDNPDFDDSIVYAYLRYTDKNKLLFVLNFSHGRNVKIKLKIPEHAFEIMKVSKDLIIYGSDILLTDFNFNISVADLKNGGINLMLKPLDSYVFRLALNP
ncbi:MAG: alpha-amylase family protein [Bacteroidales bacterium]|nr:alpha-amylase family protein [Bacteroidales bacterium]